MHSCFFIEMRDLDRDTPDKMKHRMRGNRLGLKRGFRSNRFQRGRLRYAVKRSGAKVKVENVNDGRTIDNTRLFLPPFSNFLVSPLPCFSFRFPSSDYFATLNAHPFAKSFHTSKFFHSWNQRGSRVCNVAAVVCFPVKLSIKVSFRKLNSERMLELIITRWTENYRYNRYCDR